MRRPLLSLLTLTAATLGTVLVAPAHADTTATISVVMTGSQEAPKLGDPDGIGSALIMLDSSTGEVCVRFHLRNIDPATAAHIHLGPVGAAGPVGIPFAAPSSGFLSQCVTASKTVVQNTIDHPGAYYVNVHNPLYPGGAVRGQLA